MTIPRTSPTSTPEEVSVGGVIVVEISSSMSVALVSLSVALTSSISGSVVVSLLVFSGSNWVVVVVVGSLGLASGSSLFEGLSMMRADIGDTLTRVVAGLILTRAPLSMVTPRVMGWVSTYGLLSAASDGGLITASGTETICARGLCMADARLTTPPEREEPSDPGRPPAASVMSVMLSELFNLLPDEGRPSDEPKKVKQRSNTQSSRSPAMAPIFVLMG
mmetsp:Transcript_147973/g.275744  ORF Transcript_147973/g.275744 Transcript_147973/m.275744 type:complete len:220 (+) Transcript_147973:1566-2225(+)